MNQAKPGKLGLRNQWTQLSGFCYFANEPSKPSQNLALDVLMNPAELGKLGFWTQVTLVSWVLEPSEPSSKVLLLWQWTQQTQLRPGFLFVLMNPAKLGKLDSRTQLTWVTCSLSSRRLAGVRTQLKPNY